ncbi:SMI1/KNR4 family protein, partial [Bartonella sp. AA1HLJMS]
MKTYTLADVVQLIDKVNKYDDEIINFGTAEDAVSDVRIKEAEKTLGLQFTTSYKDFLKNYKGGEIGYEEIFSIYNASFEDHPAGDIVHKNLYHRKHGFATLEQLVVSRTDFGETFYFDYTQFQDGECPLYVKIPSGASHYYASNFYEFLCKRI